MKGNQTRPENVPSPGSYGQGAVAPPLAYPREGCPLFINRKSGCCSWKQRRTPVLFGEQCSSDRYPPLLQPLICAFSDWGPSDTSGLLILVLALCRVGIRMVRSPDYKSPTGLAIDKYRPYSGPERASDPPLACGRPVTPERQARELNACDQPRCSLFLTR